MKMNRNTIYEIRRTKDEGRGTKSSRTSYFVLYISTVVFLFFSLPAFADVAIETSISRSKLPVGEQLVLDIVISNADGRIEQPSIGSIDGFISYSQGHSQEISIINGNSSSRNIYSYVLVANSTGEKTIGPFRVVIGGKEYTIAPVKVEVTQTGTSQGSYTWTQTPVTTPPTRAMPGANVGDQDIFVKAWLDRDEVYVNEPAILTYTLFTRLSATFKGFEKEPVTTGFWLEDFPPEKTVRRTEQFLNGQRYVVADVRKVALFPTQAGVFTVDPGTIAASVEVRNDDSFQTFFSGNVFGSRRQGFPPVFTTQVVPKVLATDAVRITAKALPVTGRPADFTGAVGRYEIESSLDKDHAEAGDPVTLRVRIRGQGNINTVQTPKLPKMDDFKVYDSSSSTNISKERLIVEGEKITETVIVPRKPGKFEIPPTAFIYFDPESGNYRTVKSEAHILEVSGITQPESVLPSSAPSSTESVYGSQEKEEVDLVASDIRFIKVSDDGKYVLKREIYREPLYWLLNGVLLLLIASGLFLSARRASGPANLKGSRLRRSHSVARAKLKAAGNLMKDGKSDAFYAELSRAVTGYFADKFGLPTQSLTLERVEELAGGLITAEQMNSIRRVFNDMSMGRFSRVQRSVEDMRESYSLADEVITFFEKVRLK